MHLLDPELADLLNGSKIDEAYNGLLLTANFHLRFAELRLWFDATGVRDSGRLAYIYN